MSKMVHDKDRDIVSILRGDYSELMQSNTSLNLQTWGYLIANYRSIFNKFYTVNSGLEQSMTW